MLLLFIILSFMFQVEQPLDEELIFESPPNEISIIEIVDYFD